MISIGHSDIEDTLEDWNQRIEDEYARRLKAGKIKRSDEMQSERDDIRSTLFSPEEVDWARKAIESLQDELDRAEVRSDPQLNTQTDDEDLDALRQETEKLQGSLRDYLP